MSALLELAERVEAATGPLYEIHAVISTLIGTTDVRDYTASLDAAMTLVPEGMAWAVASIDDNLDDRPLAVVGYRPVHPQHEPDHWKVRAAAPALALTAAALRARAASPEPRSE